MDVPFFLRTNTPLIHNTIFTENVLSLFSGLEFLIKNPVHVRFAGC